MGVTPHIYGPQRMVHSYMVETMAKARRLGKPKIYHYLAMSVCQLMEGRGNVEVGLLLF